MLDGPRLAPAAGGPPTSLGIFLHGFGSNGHDLIGLAQMLQPALPNTAFVAPNAPSLMPHMADAHQWWAIDRFSAAESAAGAEAAAPALDAFLTHELERSGLAADRLFLLGFSQGTMMALHVGLRRAAPVAGIVGLSGKLVAPERLQAEIKSRPPVLLVHGTADEVVPFAALDQATTALGAGGVDVETHVSTGIGHTVGPDGLSAAATFARRVLG